MEGLPLARWMVQGRVPGLHSEQRRLSLLLPQAEFYSPLVGPTCCKLASPKGVGSSFLSTCWLSLALGVLCSLQDLCRPHTEETGVS